MNLDSQIRSKTKLEHVANIDLTLTNGDIARNKAELNVIDSTTESDNVIYIFF